MAATPILVDSSYYITLVRKGRDPLRALTLGAATGDLATCGVVRCEVGRGIRRPEIRAMFSRFWDVMLNVPTDHRLWSQVEETSWQLDRRGVILPLPDLIIGCCALQVGASVLTFDGHFNEIPGLQVIHRID